MSVKYIPVQWNNNKYIYDAVMLVGAALFLYVFLYAAPGALNHERAVNPQIHNARAFGACAFVMLTVILCIGPLARLNPRFLPLLYNRRHFGVMTTFVAITHASYVVDWYFAFSRSNKYEAVLFANTSYGQLAGFPFEIFGVFALLVLIILAATSHDFWLKFLSPPVWKRLHYLIYPAYLAVVAHVSLGILQDQQNHTFTVIFIGGAGAVGGLHLLAALSERRQEKTEETRQTDWVDVCRTSEMTDGFAKIKLLANGERVAVYLTQGKLSAISNACAHQNGPLGEGRVIDCLVTCPWHGFQYDVTSGRSPAPFTEVVPTYNLRLDGDRVLVDPKANPPGTYVEPIEVRDLVKGL
ncbi:(2Fe-2S)-binding protein [Roseobacter denitrificans]|uniref:Rieske 2Fe-2S domain protein n=1 Tax=Roseobacter denitrificans (strain ATCC 33942 / OCh 114) TaxID=375451 RepID=Q16B18_ROSDO|nr:Rieske 2Fe-2S domain-containing protein [Roseobacter denitrificans]ABG30825.1 Rieske 2Fe-2S domain protein [Roseobacter denitrificans OCh 114]AVL53930.1 (2Fe-2S)-binding protein [Roseobacter denitrificans]SFG15717.1 Ferredoxin subunit of nitrite reductase or a ring-hydroxylating dioxygenase [Roseobacter denitrificans OCh 114]